MKSSIKLIAYLLLTSTLFFAACKKEPPLPSAELSKEVQFTIDAVPTEPAVYALVTITNASGQELVVNKRLNLILSNNKYVTEKLQLEAGSYNLSKFVINNDANLTRFAAPVRGSIKASQVNKPLAIQLKLPNTSLLNVPIEVLKVEAADTPELYGYPAGAFNHPPAQQEDFFKVKLKAVLSIGDIVYDSIPAQFRIITWTNQGILSQKDTLLEAGSREIQLSKSATKYTISLTKWGITDEVTVQKAEVADGAVYILGESKAAKKLKSTDEYSFQDGSFKLHQRRLFEYDNLGRLKEIKLYRYEPVKHTATTVFAYTGSKLKIYTIDHQNGSSENHMYTAFLFDGQGRRTRSEFKYITEHLFYENTYQNNGITMYTVDQNNSRTGFELRFKFSGGNRVEQTWVNPISTSTTRYKYDFSINPYAHMKWPDLYFENMSKNNVVEVGSALNGETSQNREKAQNTYDSEGYLTETIKSTFLTSINNYRYHSKTVFTY